MKQFKSTTEETIVNKYETLGHDGRCYWDDFRVTGPQEGLLTTAPLGACEGGHSYLCLLWGNILASTANILDTKMMDGASSLLEHSKKAGRHSQAEQRHSVCVSLCLCVYPCVCLCVHLVSAAASPHAEPQTWVLHHSAASPPSRG